MDIDIAIGLAGAAIGFVAGFVTYAIIAAICSTDTDEAFASMLSVMRSQQRQLDDYRAAEQRRSSSQRKAALAKAREVNAARNATKSEAAEA